MYAFELFEQQKPRIVVTYPGRFQPFHQGHADVFKQLQKKFGMENVYIATSNDQSSAKSPFSFSDKYQLMTAAGVPGDKIIETNTMYSVPEGVNPANTIFITAVGAPDADRLNPDTVLKRDKKDKDGNIIKPAGSPGYYKIWANIEQAITADQHGYVTVIPEIKKSIKILDQDYDVSHGTEVRNLWNAVRDNDDAKQEFLKQLYGKYSQHLEQIFNKIPAPLNEAGGYIPTEAEKNDPRFSMALTNDIRPGATGKEANKLGLQTDAQGKPALLMSKTKLKESIGDVDMTQVFAKFLPIAMGVLKIDKLPAIKLHKHVDAGDSQPTFGMYNPNNGEINLSLADRHPTDILRTLAHELVHFAQDQRKELHDDSGQTGSNHENEANAIAGIIMRMFSKKNPELIKSKPLNLAEVVTVNYGIGKNPGALAKVGPNGRVPRAKMHVNVDKKTAKKLGIPVTETIPTITEEKCPDCGGPMFSELMLNEKQDACYYKVKSRYKVWPSAYASGALVQCRKKGAKNWGNKK